MKKRESVTDNDSLVGKLYGEIAAIVLFVVLAVVFAIYGRSGHRVGVWIALAVAAKSLFGALRAYRQIRKR